MNPGSWGSLQLDANLRGFLCQKGQKEPLPLPLRFSVRRISGYLPLIDLSNQREFPDSWAGFS